MKHVLAAALALLLAACVSDTTASIDAARAEAPVRQSCPAFRSGAFTADAARTSGAEQITNFQNGSRFTCRCVAKSQSVAPSCQQVAKFGPIRLEP
ncbi:MAG: hypothetical protein ACRCTI_15750 [Beijerinckiaceae bacterium]